MITYKTNRNSLVITEDLETWGNTRYYLISFSPEERELYAVTSFCSNDKILNQHFTIFCLGRKYSEYFNLNIKTV